MVNCEWTFVKKILLKIFRYTLIECWQPMGINACEAFKRNSITNVVRCYLKHCMKSINWTAISSDAVVKKVFSFLELISCYVNNHLVICQ